MQFQPSEIAKIAVILFIPYVILKMGKQAKRAKATVVLLVLGLLQAGEAYLFTENLSTAIIIMAISCVIIFLSHPRTRPFLLILLIAAAVIAAVLFFLYQNVESSTDFRLNRVLTWLHPEDHQDSGGYQVLQALYAIGLGRIFR